MDHGQGRVPPAGPPWAACALWFTSEAALRSSGVLFRIKNLRKFSSNSENIYISEIQKQQKQGTGTGHLVNRLVQQNA